MSTKNGSVRTTKFTYSDSGYDNSDYDRDFNLIKAALGGNNMVVKLLLM